MKKKNTIIALLSVAALLFAAPAFAGNYFLGKAGFYNPKESALDNGLNLEGAYGIDLSNATKIDKLALELGFGYYTASGDESLFGIATELDVNVLPVTASGIYTYDFKRHPFSVYGGAGLGLYFVMWELNTRDPFFGNTTVDDEELKLGFHLVGGGRFELNKQMELFAELKANRVSGDWGGKFLNVGLKYNF